MAGALGRAGDVDAVCGPVLIEHAEIFGRVLRADEYAVASGEHAKPTCLVSPSDDLNDAMRRMMAIDASVLLVARRPLPVARRSSREEDGEDAPLFASDVIGVVTKSDRSNVSSRRRRPEFRQALEGGGLGHAGL